MVSFNRTARISRPSVPRPSLPSFSVSLPAMPSLRARRPRRPEGGVDLSVGLATDVAEPRPSLASRLSLPARPAGLGLRLPGGHVDFRWLVALSGIAVLLVMATSLLRTPAPTKAAAPVRSAAPVKAKPVAPASVPFSQAAVNSELRALRRNLAGTESVRSLTLMGDGTMGMLIVSGKRAVSVVAGPHELVREPIEGWSSLRKDAELDLKSVHGIAPTKLLAAATKQFHLPASQLATLKLAPIADGSATFIWKATYRDAARTVLYADREGDGLGRTKPATTLVP